MNLTEKATIPAQVMARQVGDETVILDLSTGTYYGLNTVGARVWMLLTEGQTPIDICAVLLTEFDVDPEVLESDVSRLLLELSDKKLLLMTETP